jgi:hypothetical protein
LKRLMLLLTSALVVAGVATALPLSGASASKAHGKKCHCRRGPRGRRGPAGPAGPRGATGPAGPQGATGPAGGGGSSNAGQPFVFNGPAGQSATILTVPGAVFEASCDVDTGALAPNQTRIRSTAENGAVMIAGQNVAVERAFGQNPFQSNQNPFNGASTPVPTYGIVAGDQNPLGDFFDTGDSYSLLDQQYQGAYPGPLAVAQNVDSGQVEYTNASAGAVVTTVQYAAAAPACGIWGTYDRVG